MTNDDIIIHDIATLHVFKNIRGAKDKVQTKVLIRFISSKQKSAIFATARGCVPSGR